jgi:hypothetical protein
MRQHKLLWASSYDRGLNVLLKMWPDIKRKFKDAELHIAYGWELFDAVTKTNAERQEWKAKMVELMKQPGIVHHGRVSKSELKKLREECGILAYCSDFTEIFCITAMECQREGCVPVTTNIGALPETVQGGIVVKGDIYDPDVKHEYLKQLTSLMDDRQHWKDLQDIGRDHAKNYSWDLIAQKWAELFTETNQDIKVSIVTPTNRRGWWNIMANNLANQTYKNFEWVIVDDYPEDRSQIASEYAKKYNLNIKYLRGKERKVKRNYGLVNADNTALQHVTGEIYLCLQDFILIPETGVEDVVILYKKNPDCLIALPDSYYAPKIKPDTESEDWFHGDLDVKGEFMRANARLTNEGLRFTQRAFDFEQNYGAIPTSILKELGGWWEFFDFGLGFNNTELAWRALQKGYGIIIDETNVATCIDHWNALEGTREHGLLRERRLNDPQFLWMMQQVKDGKLPLVRTQELDDQINLTYEMPELGQQDAVEWMREHMDEIVEKWL